MRDEGRWEMEEVGWHQAQPPRRAGIRCRGKEGRKKAAELWGFAAWNVRDGVLDSTYQLSCPRDSCDYTGTGRYSLFMMMRVPAAEEAWPMAPCMLEYVG